MLIFKKHLWTGWIRTAFGTIFVLAPLLSHAQDLTYTFNGAVIERPTYYDLKSSDLLNPGGKILDLPSWSNKFYGDINFDLKYQDTKLITKFRPTVLSDDDRTSFRNYIDDLYSDTKMGDHFFFYVGKRNISDGVALGSNPTDFLGEDKPVDYTIREEQRRQEREGNYLAGMDAFYHDITLTAIFAPYMRDLQSQGDRTLLKASYLIEPIDTDVSLHYFNSSVPGEGFNVSHTVNDKLVVYSETAFREGRLHPELTSMNDKGIFPHTATGGHYTFTNGTNIICEYIYNGDGYSQKKWDDFEGFVDSKANLAQANELMTFREMRKNYFFTRVGNPDIFNKFDGAMVVYLNLDDGSVVLNPSLDYKIRPNTTIGISSDIFVGGKTTEFGMMYWGEDITLTYKYYF